MQESWNDTLAPDVDEDIGSCSINTLTIASVDNFRDYHLFQAPSQPGPYIYAYSFKHFKMEMEFVYQFFVW